MNQHSAKFTELVKKLREIFQIDKPELDFGVYRILNARAGEINDYLENRLPEKIKAALDNGNASHKEQTARELQEKEAQYKADGINPDSVPKVVELRQKLAAYTSGNAEHENAVFSHLLSFFSRYYDNGDFISQRRYKGDTYAIPYAGEEVMLHWANKDQYYTKSGENFSNYSFKLDDGQGGQRLVHCRLVAADTAKDNRKDNDKERRFALIEKKTVIRIDDDGDEYEEELIPVESINKTVMENGVEVLKASELILRFEYIPMPKGCKQAELTSKAVKAILADAIVQSKWLDLGKRAPTEKDPQRTLLEKHLSDYTTKNTADYFIHKDLGGFLKRELDFYIKNEVMHLDDVQNAEKFSDIEKSLRMIQCLRAIALELITFLAQLEDFQKKLWLKKKFVVSAHYCMTLDRVPEELYPEIAANQKQWNEWRKLGFWNSPNIGVISDLNENLNWIIDTSLYDFEFKNSLIASIENVEESIDGIVLQSDNFHALALFEKRYSKKIKCVYIDPPYNTGGDDFLYKDGYQSGSWVTLMHNRLEVASTLIDENSIVAVSLDSREVDNLTKVVSLAMKIPLIQRVIWKKTDSPNEKENAISSYHEYLSIYGNDGTKRNLNQLRKQEILDAYSDKDSDGRLYRLRQARKNGASARREDRPSLYYELTAPDGSSVFPMSPEGWQGRWVMKKDSFTTLSDDNLIIWKQRDYGWVPYYKEYAPTDPMTPYSSIWDDVDQNRQAKAEYTAVMGGVPFSNPKPTSLIERVISIACKDHDVVLDFFAGSGTTAHSVIQFNRKNSSHVKYILIEQGDYFDSIIQPRLKKAVGCKDWNDGKPLNIETGISHCFKVLKLESYEDTLNNLELQRSTAQADLLSNMSAENRDDYLLRYMLDVESRCSLLPVEAFRKPFNVKLKVAVDSAGAFEERNIDLVETFNYLIGLTVKQMELALDRGYARIEGTLPSGENTLILWRDCERIGYEELMRYTERFDLNTRKDIFDVVYINGDHNIPTVLTATEEEGGTTHSFKLRQIEPEFLQKMFAVEDI